MKPRITVAAVAAGLTILGSAGVAHGTGPAGISQDHHSNGHGKVLPLSDPANSGHWRPVTRLTDEFNGTKVNTHKWYDYHPFWAGRAPSYFDASNVAVKNGKLKLSFRDLNFVQNHSFEQGMTSWQPTGEASVVDNGQLSRKAIELGPGGSVEQVVQGLKPDTRYEMTVMMKQTGDAKGWISASSTGSPTVSRPGAKTGQFSTLQATFRTGPHERSAHLTLRNDGQGTVRAMQASVVTPNPTVPTGSFYSAAALHSKTRATYGYYEVRAKVADASHTSAFWLKGDTTEIDVYETVGGSLAVPDAQYEVSSNTHYYPNGWATDENDPFNYKSKDRQADKFHTYGVDWQPDTIRYYYDGQLIRTQDNKHSTEPLYLILDSETFWWHGFPTPETLPSTYLIDYVRGWKHRS